MDRRRGKLFIVDGKSAKNCSVCNNIKLLEYFQKSNNNFLGYSSICKSCLSKRRNGRHHGYNIKRYKINSQQYNEILNIQGKVCAICKRPCKSGRNLSVDHNHITGKVRGLLCIKCNQALGCLEEDENIIWNMLEYLKFYEWNIKVS